MIKKQNICVTGNHQKPIVTDLYFTHDTIKKPLVIFCHGYKGFKDWGPWPLVAETFAKQGCFFVSFNFSHNGGTPEQPIDFPDLEAFGQNNFIKELDDLDAIITWILNNNSYKHHIDSENITLIGHSRGGGIVTIKAAENPLIKNVVSWAGVSDYQARFPDGDVLEMWRKNGVAYIENSRTKQQMPHYYQFYTNFMENKTRLSIKLACKKLGKNHLIIHGTEDETVSVHEAKALQKWNPESVLKIITGANHTFNATHPYKESALTENLKKVVNTTLEFIKNADR